MLIRYFLIKFYLWWSKDQRSLQIELRFNYDIQFHWLLKSQPFFPRGQKTFQNKNKVFIDIKRTLIIDFLTIKFGSFSFIGQQIWRKKNTQKFCKEPHFDSFWGLPKSKVFNTLHSSLKNVFTSCIFFYQGNQHSLRSKQHFMELYKESNSLFKWQLYMIIYHLQNYKLEKFSNLYKNGKNKNSLFLISDSKLTTSQWTSLLTLDTLFNILFESLSHSVVPFWCQGLWF